MKNVLLALPLLLAFSLSGGEFTVGSNASVPSQLTSIDISGEPGAFTRAVSDFALGRQYTQMVYGGKFEQLWEAMSDSMRKQQGSISNLIKFRQTVQELVGKELKVLDEKVMPTAEQEVYVATTTIII